MKRCRYCHVEITIRKKVCCGATPCERRRKADKQRTWYKNRASLGKPMFRSKVKYISRKCKFCGSNCGRRFYCSDECIRAQRRLEAKDRYASEFKAELERRPMVICLECGSAFRRFRHRRYYCSFLCSKKVERMGKRDRDAINRILIGDSGFSISDIPEGIVEAAKLLRALNQEIWRQQCPNLILESKCTSV